MENNLTGTYVYGIWGQNKYEDVNINSKKMFHITGSRTKIESDIALTKLSPFTPKNSVVYCFGKENLKYLEDKGFNCKLIDNRPYVWDMNNEWWRHKLEVIKCGLEEKCPMIYLDWDCMAVRKIPDNIWSEMSKKSHIQTPLKVYTQKRAYWRKDNHRIIVEGAFTYFREDISKELIKTWENSADKWLDETILAKYIDDINGGWKGIKDYCEKYDPFFQIPGDHRVYVDDYREKKYFFQHIPCKYVSRILFQIKNKGYKWESIFK
jgi:hypothetical protein